MKFKALLTVILLMFSGQAFAHHHRHHHHHHHHSIHHGGRHVAQRSADLGTGEVIGGRPAGCPHAYCGCGASLYLFGKVVDGLNLAAEWGRRFAHVPLEAAQAGMAAVAPGRHHVVVLEQRVGEGTWIVHDSNSGHGLTRRHARNISGWTVVNPHSA